MTIGKGSVVLRAPSQGKVGTMQLLQCVFALGCNNEARHWLAMVRALGRSWHLTETLEMNKIKCSF